MNRDDIIRMAREVGMQGMLTDVVTTLNELERFARLATAAAKAEEREACALACRQIANAYIDSTDALSVGINHGAISCAIAIELREARNEQG